MATNSMQLLHVLVIALTATHIVSGVSSSRLLLQSKSAAAVTDGTSSGDLKDDSLPNHATLSGDQKDDSLSNHGQMFHDIDFQQLSSGGETSTDSETEVTSNLPDYGTHQKISCAQTTSSERSTEATTAPYFPDYETHDNSPGFNGRRR